MQENISDMDEIIKVPNKYLVGILNLIPDFIKIVFSRRVIRDAASMIGN